MLLQLIAQVSHSARRLPLRKINIGMVTGLLSLAIAHSAVAAPAQDPLFLSNPVVPIMMLNMSKDHQLYYKIYDDYSDLDGGGEDTTYKNSYDYYGYFDSQKCYTYNTTNNQFEPSRKVSLAGYCNDGVTGEWSGNFLNWSSMTRIDSIRKILYGGLRSIDTATATVLERALLPHDAHSFAKFYNGADLAQLTPFTVATVPVGLAGVSATGITICNTTPGGSELSQNVTNAPLLRVAKGNYTFWASNERWQCRWNSDKAAANGNDASVTGVYAYGDAPADDNKLGSGSAAGEFYARVKVCVAGLEEANCYQYPSGNKKPQGLLQEFGEIRDGSTVAKINFGLLTGSYSKNKSGGLLRKTVGNLMAEINATTNGIFTNTSGAIKTLNSLRPYGYRYSNGTYFGVTGSDNCQWGWGSFSNGQCTNWGNPQAEIFLESLRYLAGKSVNSEFVEAEATLNDAARIPGLSAPAWGDNPVTATNYCAPLSVLQFNASTTSYDGDDLSTASEIMGAGSLDVWTKKIADSSHENLTGSFFVGNNGSLADELCTSKSITDLSAVRGTCPDAPRLQGSYQIAGLAYYARTNDIIPGATVKGAQTVRTYGVALSPALPKVTVNVPGSTTGKQVTILPACRNKAITPEANCAIVDFKILSQSADKSSGTLYVNWEDSEQGGDYDQDMWGVIKYEVTATDVKVTTDVIAESTPNVMGFGYVISGTTNDGFKVHSGIHGYSGYGCSSCNTGDAEAAVTYKVGSDGAKLLESPLYYAAKWGGYSEALVKKVKEEKGETYSDADLLAAIKTTTPESYYFATDPRALEASLRTAFRDVAKALGSASAVATNSTRLSEGSYIFQAQFNSEDWSGTLNAFEFDDKGGLPETPTFSSSKEESMPKTGAGRKVYTYKDTSRIDFAWASLDTIQKTALQLVGDVSTTEAQNRVDWLLGNSTYEDNVTGLRERGSGATRNILGDIVNSSPAYVGVRDYGYYRLPVGGGSYRAFVETKKTKIPRVFVGANDGMVHAFQAPTKEIVSGEQFKELWAYIPNIAFSKLAKTTQPSYGSTENPHQFIVDGPISVGDVYINGAWRTIIVGSLGAGGRGLYALDVTDATQPPVVLWELNTTNFPKLGYVMGAPLIVPMKNNRWAAVFGNGSASGSTSSLFVIDIEKPKLTDGYSKVLDTGAGTGLSAPEVLPSPIGQAQLAYAGDLNGNVWRFDLSANVASSWKKDYLLFSATDKFANVQPITGAPTLGLNASLGNKVMVYFGTGKYFDAGDNSTSSTPVHSFYAIADVGTVQVNRSDLFPKTLDTTYGTSSNTRTVEQDVAKPIQSPDWAIYKGWHLDFDDTAGERVTTRAILFQDKLIFPTLIPSASACEYGGRSWLMEVIAVGDRPSRAPMVAKYNDFLLLGDLGLGKLPPIKDAPSSSGTTSSGSASSVADECGGGGASGAAAIVGSGTNATLMNVSTTYSVCGEGRQSWRQLQ